MEYLKIRNWDKWQTYRSDRGQPPWIKIHRCVMRNPEWVSLTDAERGQLVAIWLLAADHDGVIPASKEIIKKLCFMSATPNLNKFAELGFIDGNLTPDRRQDDADMTHQTRIEKTRIEKNREDRGRNFIPPLVDDVISFFKEKGYTTEVGKKAFEYYSTAGWKDSRGKQVKNWKQKMIAVWFKDENKTEEKKYISVEKACIRCGDCNWVRLKGGVCEKCLEKETSPHRGGR